MKGQAFDTFKLMIAAVVAVAILGILLGILGQIKPPTGDPQTVIKDYAALASNSVGAVRTTPVVQFSGSNGDTWPLSASESGSINSISCKTSGATYGILKCENSGSGTDLTGTIILTTTGQVNVKLSVTCSGSSTCTIDFVAP